MIQPKLFWSYFVCKPSVPHIRICSWALDVFFDFFFFFGGFVAVGLKLIEVFFFVAAFLFFRWWLEGRFFPWVVEAFFPSGGKE